MAKKKVVELGENANKEKIAELRETIKKLEEQVKEYNVDRTQVGWYNRTPNEYYIAYNGLRRAKSLLQVLEKVGQPIFKIRNTENGTYSTGLLNRGSTASKITFNKKGKTWTSEALVKKHLLKCIIEGGGIPENWEVVKLIEEPVLELNEWMDSEMTMAMLKYQNKN